MTDRPIRKIDIDGAYRVHFDPTINYRDRQSKYAAAYAKLHDASLIYVAERLSTKWAFRLWNPPCNRINNRLGECRNEIRRDFRDRLVEDGLGKSLAKNGLYFENMKWGTNARYAIYERETERDYTFGSSHVQFEGVDGFLPHGSVADYSVYFVYSNVHEHKKLLYVVERIGKSWVWNRWDGADVPAGRNLDECKVTIWRHMDAWFRTKEYEDRIEQYKRLSIAQP